MDCIHTDVDRTITKYTNTLGRNQTKKNNTDREIKNSGEYMEVC